MDIQNCVMTDQYKRIQGAGLKLQNKTIPVYKGVNTVGRNKAAIINLKNVNVSQHHALIIIVDDTQHFISDLNSSNGTYLLDTRLAPFKLYELSNEAKIKFGDEVASYLKMTNLSTTVHLEAEPMEMTQNTTQNFYAATTQLMFDNSSFNQTRLSSLPHHNINNDTQNIHEVATQVVPYHSKINDTNVEDNVLVESVNEDIHEAATQVVVFDPQPSTSRALQDTEIQKTHEEDIHEIATQVVLFPPERMCSNKGGRNEEKELDSPKINKNMSDSSISIGKSDSDKLNDRPFSPNDDSFMNNQNIAEIESSVIQDSVIEATMMEEKAENVKTVIENGAAANDDSNSNGSMDFLTMPFDAGAPQYSDKTNMADDKKSTTSESQDIEQPRRRPVRKLSSSEDFSENQNKPKICNSDSETDIDDAEDIVNMNKEKLKLSSEAQTNNKASNSDSETDIEDDVPKTNKKSAKTIQSDSETDIEDEVLHNLTQSEDIVKPKVLFRKSVFSSDSETEVEGSKEPDPVLEAAEDLDSGATEILNDTDCIPATQDAFADMFQYKNSKLSHSNQSQNQSSEESFKLGLTELMSEGENNQSINEQIPTDEGHSVNQIQNSSGSKSTEDVHMTSKSKSNDKVESGKADEDDYLTPTQKNEDKENLDTGKLPTASTSGVVTNIEKDAEEDLYMMATQKVNEDLFVAKKINEPSIIPSTSKMVNRTEREADEDFYMMPTQKINESEHEFKTPTKKFTFKKKTANLEGSLTSILSSKEDDAYLMATQKLNETEDNNDDDIYMQPTQKLPNNTQKSQGDDDSEAKNAVYMQPTQDLNHIGLNVLETKEDQADEDLYMAPTQQINQNSISSLYMLETQKVDSQPNLDNIKTSRNEQAEKNDLYDLPTQPLSHALESGGEFLLSHENPTSASGPEGQVETRTSAKHLLVINQDSPRRKRMKKSDLENLKRVIESTEKIDDAETLSQIDAFVKKPSERHETEDDDRAETLSQIEAFVKKPVENVPIKEENSGQSKILADEQIKKLNRSEREASVEKPCNTFLLKAKKHLPSKKSISASVNQKEEEVDRPETLSQIEAFVKKPLEPEQFTRMSRTRQLTKPSEEDLYSAPTQEINQDLIDDKVTNKSEESSKLSREMIGAKKLLNTELYMLETQKIDSQPDVGAGKNPENNKSSHVLGCKDTITSAKSLEVIDLDAPKKKKLKKSDTENLGKTTDSKNEDEEIERPETLSQIDAFIKKPLDVVAPKSRKLPKIEEKPSTSSSKKRDQPGKSADVTEFEKPKTSSRVSRTRQSVKLVGEENRQEIWNTPSESTDSKKPQKSNEAPTEKLEIIDVNGDKNANTSSSDPDTIRSDIDQSFALLEAKSTKTRKSSRITNVGEIKVAARKNRRSMTTSSIVDLTKDKVVESRPTTRKSRMVTVNNNIVATVPESKAVDSSRRPISRGITTKRKSDSSDSDFLESEIPTKKSKMGELRKGKRKASVAEDIDKASTTNEASNKEVPSEVSKTNTRKGRGKTTVEDDIIDVDKPSTSNEENNREVSSKAPKASVATRGKAKATVVDDTDKASTTSEESNIEVSSSKTSRAGMASRSKAKATVIDDADKASTTSEENNREVSSKTSRASAATKGKAKAPVADDIDKASTASEESNKVSAKTPKASAARKGRGKSIARDEVDEISTASEESNKSKELATPSTSRVRASSRMTISKKSEDDRSESGSARDSPMATPSRRGRKNVPDDLLLVSPERSKRKQRPKVVFTMMDDPQLESLIRQLGGSVVDSVDASTVLVTEHVKRSQKLLTAVGQGKPICSPSWIRASKKANEFLDPWEFILMDKEAESKWNFSLKESITKATNEKLLVNYSFHLMVSSAIDVLKGAIESCGGKCVTRNPPKNVEGFYVVVSSPENRNKYLKIKKQNPEVTIVEPEAIFDGVLRQDLRLGRYLLT